MKRKKLAGLLLAAVMVMGSTTGVLAASIQQSWNVGSYPGVPSGSSKVMIDGTGGSYCNISCNSYSSSNGTPVVFSSGNFSSSVSIGGTGTVYATKRTAKLNNQYTVNYSANGSGRTVANGKITG